MNIPKKLKIGGHIFNIVQEEIPSSSLGITHNVNNKIIIEKNMSKSMKEATLIHEIFHAINTTFDEMPLGHSLMDSLAEQFYQVLSDNKLLK